MKIEQYKNLIEAHTKYKTQKVKGLKVIHSQLEDFLLNELSNSVFKKEKIGLSSEKRNLYALTAGKGKYQILFFSQMHGNEACGTKSLLDLLNFFSKKNDEFDSFRQNILSKIKLHILPMINPDGAERFTRQNFFGTDINRDALSLYSSEAQALMSYIDSVAPDCIFSLHDQPAHYAVAKTGLPAAFSFLAPVFDEKLTINNTRLKAMQYINAMAKMASSTFPGQIARYSDAYMPNAFGDRLAEKGYCSILVETGNIKGDWGKEKLRTAQFAFLTEVMNIALSNEIPSDTTDYYANISLMKTNKWFHFVIRNITISKESVSQKTDLGINKENVGEELKFVIKEIGDLRFRKGFYEFDANGKFASEPVSYQSDADFLIQSFFQAN